MSQLISPIPFVPSFLVVFIYATKAVSKRIANSSHILFFFNLFFIPFALTGGFRFEFMRILFFYKVRRELNVNIDEVSQY